MVEQLSVISIRAADEPVFKVHKAPSGMVYAFHGFGFINRTDETAPDILLVIPRHLEEPITGEGVQQESIYAFGLDVVANVNTTAYFYHDIPIIAKTITVYNPTLGSDLNIFLQLYYRLIPASKSQLIWEFIRRGKSP